MRSSPDLPAAAGPGSSAGGGLGGALPALVDTTSVTALGIRIEIDGRDGPLLVAAFFGSSFILLGLFAGYVIEGRRRDRAS